MPTATDDCQHSVDKSCRLVNSKAFSIAKSRLRRRTDAASVRPRAITAVSASTAARRAGIEPIVW